MRVLGVCCIRRALNSSCMGSGMSFEFQLDGGRFCSCLHTIHKPADQDPNRASCVRLLKDVGCLMEEVGIEWSVRKRHMETRAQHP